MTAYYNEIDPYAAEWLKNLIAAGHIAPGIVDSRSIEDVRPDDLFEFTQCHFFAGIGVWSYALRLAGWPDDRPVWTGSCPCQPFSAAGKGDGFDDERHLWPSWFHLIGERKPPVVFGEQVEAAIRHGWLDLVQADMEGIGYAFAAAGIPAAGVGAPHIRQRLYFVADTADIRRDQQRGAESLALQGQCAERGGEHAKSRRAGELSRGLEGLGGTSLLDDDEGLEGQRSRHQAESGQDGAVRPVVEAGEFGGMADDQLQQRPCGEPRLGVEHETHRRDEGAATTTGFRADSRAGPTNGHWRDADWLFCRDGKWRPVEPGTFPLVNGATSRVGRLRAYGNAIVPQVAAEMIRAFMECQP